MCPSVFWVQGLGTVKVRLPKGDSLFFCGGRCRKGVKPSRTEEQGKNGGMIPLKMWQND